jgi:acetoacetyl-CoA reductase
MRVALITGGTRGIGAAISIKLKEAGYKVAAIYAGNDEVANEFSKKNKIAIFKWSIANYEECVAGIKSVEEELGAIDILVNNAGITRDGMFHKMSKEQWRDVINVNLNGLFNMTHPLWDGMRARGFGRIVNISSINGQKGQLGQANYSAAKAGELGFTKSLALEGARKGITVNAICPGYINTDMVKAMSEKAIEATESQIPVGRLGEPDDIARCVKFLIADDSSFITGSTITANGGHYLI